VQRLTLTHNLQCFTRGDESYRLSRNVCNDCRSALRNIAEERRSDTYRSIKPELTSSANNIYIDIQPGKCRIHIL